MWLLVGLLLGAVFMMLVGKKRHHYRNAEMDALLAEYKSIKSPYPSWVDDEQTLADVMQRIYQQAQLQQLPKNYVEEAFKIPVSQDKLLRTAQIMERRKASVEDQIKAVVLQLTKTWESLSDEERSVFICVEK